MSTRCSIAIRSEAGPVYGIICHSDGDPAGVGAILAEHYTGRGEVWKIIRLGHLVRLCPQLAPTPGMSHTFLRPEEDVTIAYGRDVGYGDCSAKARKCADLTAWKTWALLAGSEWLYLYDEASREWHYSAGRCYAEYPNAGWMRPLVPPPPVPQLSGDVPVIVIPSNGWSHRQAA